MYDVSIKFCFLKLVSLKKREKKRTYGAEELIQPSTSANVNAASLSVRRFLVLSAPVTLVNLETGAMRSMGCAAVSACTSSICNCLYG